MYNSGNSARQFDPEALQALARQETSASRSELAQSIVFLFDRPADKLSPEARAMAYDILHAIVRDIEMATRQEIARRLADRNDAPPELIRFLANDTIEVAYPILVQSGVLDDADLIEIIRLRTTEHSLAIATRPSLSPSVTDALVKTDAEDVIVAVLKNQGAEVAPGTMTHLVEKSRQRRAIREPILMRKEMNPELALRMFIWVSTALREHILRNFDFDRDAVNKLCDQIMLDEIEHFSRDSVSKGELSKRLAALIKNKGKLTPEMLVLALRDGDVNTFVTLFGRMTDLKAHMIDRLLFDPTGKGLAIACKGIGAGKIAFVSLFALAQKIRAEVTGTIKLRLHEAIDFYDTLPTKDAADVLAEWRRGGDYVGSIRVLTHRMQTLRH
ncbi:MAG: DUF2336 domain-containing protein [Rhodospirillales bacterium]|nr:DUF2336 domain-containing protein [Rhodospirillales bacterium]